MRRDISTNDEILAAIKRVHERGEHPSFHVAITLERLHCSQERFAVFKAEFKARTWAIFANSHTPVSSTWVRHHEPECRQPCAIDPAVIQLQPYRSQGGHGHDRPKPAKAERVITEHQKLMREVKAAWDRLREPVTMHKRRDETGRKVRT